MPRCVTALSALFRVSSSTEIGRFQTGMAVPENELECPDYKEIAAYTPVALPG
jgi:hypothetical protein